MWFAFVFGSLLIIGVWIGISLGAIGLIIMYFLGGSLTSTMVSIWGMVFCFPLVAIPLYVLLGEIFVASGLSKKTYTSLAPLLERFPGKLLLTNTVVCAIFGAISGTSMATAAAVGSVAYPELSKRGYNRQVLVGNLAGSGTLGLLIPPSFTLILYGAWEGVSVGGLFIAAILPGLLMASLFLLFVVVSCLIRPDIVPPSAETVPLRRAIMNTKGIWPMAILIFCVLGTIYLGIATPTEAAGLGAMAAIILMISFRQFSFKKLYNALNETIKIQVLIGLILIGATIFSISISMLGIPRQIVVGIGEAGLSPLMIKIFVYILYLILGCFLNGSAMLLMTLPFTYPLMMSIGCDPFWFGIVLVVVTEMGQLTPPVGVNLYVLQGVTKGEVSLGEVAKGSIPYFLIQGLVLIIITIFPQICTWLPSLMG